MDVSGSTVNTTDSLSYTTIRRRYSDLSGDQHEEQPTPDVSSQNTYEQADETRMRNALRQIMRNPLPTFPSSSTVLMWAIHLTSLAYTALDTVLFYTGKITRGVYRSLQTETYYFFKGSYVPYDSRQVKLNVAGVPHVEWYYNPTTKVFSKQEAEGQPKHFPYLTAEVYHDTLSLYDLTSFVENIRWVGGETPPSPNHILSAWFLETGILLDPTLPLVLQVINENGDTQRLRIHE